MSYKIHLLQCERNICQVLEQYLYRFKSWQSLHENNKDFLDRTFVISFPLFQHLWKGKNNCGNSLTNSCWPTIFEARLRIWQIQFQNYISCQCSDPNFELDPKASTQVTPSLVKPRKEKVSLSIETFQTVVHSGQTCIRLHGESLREAVFRRP